MPFRYMTPVWYVESFILAPLVELVDLLYCTLRTAAHEARNFRENIGKIASQEKITPWDMPSIRFRSMCNRHITSSLRLSSVLRATDP